ncbi:hypothetical protein DFA_02969 [Cavenderia fasciculata]|uniref:Uncharacterized protein n=1 Tax=Cavenderia fasciculata TaxID=261658 RepID=F4PG91_CACFS|nr:uncharacterized protein DFA_02969 [Cavenderia fasciculata]EGG24725.1 hypothetical protein DFA_02969 [Cavenderia fasciculata]|eukprot:XP_004362576.1 hypothetical protein DFA_02969 [Cavenderia fasciculata]
MMMLNHTIKYGYTSAINNIARYGVNRIGQFKTTTSTPTSILDNTSSISNIRYYSTTTTTTTKTTTTTTAEPLLNISNVNKNNNKKKTTTTNTPPPTTSDTTTISSKIQDYENNYSKIEQLLKNGKIVMKLVKSLEYHARLDLLVKIFSYSTLVVSTRLIDQIIYDCENSKTSLGEIETFLDSYNDSAEGATSVAASLVGAEFKRGTKVKVSHHHTFNTKLLGDAFVVLDDNVSADLMKGLFEIANSNDSVGGLHKFIWRDNICQHIVRTLLNLNRYNVALRWFAHTSELENAWELRLSLLHLFQTYHTIKSTPKEKEQDEGKEKEEKQDNNLILVHQQLATNYGQIVVRQVDAAAINGYKKSKQSSMNRIESSIRNSRTLPPTHPHQEQLSNLVQKYNDCLLALNTPGPRDSGKIIGELKLASSKIKDLLLNSPQFYSTPRQSKLPSGTVFLEAVNIITDSRAKYFELMKPSTPSIVRTLAFKPSYYQNYLFKGDGDVPDLLEILEHSQSNTVVLSSMVPRMLFRGLTKARYVQDAVALMESTPVRLNYHDFARIAELIASHEAETFIRTETLKLLEKMMEATPKTKVQEDIEQQQEEMESKTKHQLHPAHQPKVLLNNSTYNQINIKIAQIMAGLQRYDSQTYNDLQYLLNFYNDMTTRLLESRDGVWYIKPTKDESKETADLIPLPKRQLQRLYNLAIRLWLANRYPNNNNNKVAIDDEVVIQELIGAEIQHYAKITLDTEASMREWIGPVCSVLVKRKQAHLVDLFLDSVEPIANIKTANGSIHSDTLFRIFNRYGNQDEKVRLMETYGKGKRLIGWSEPLYRYLKKFIRKDTRDDKKDNIAQHLMSQLTRRDKDLTDQNRIYLSNLKRNK